MNWLPFVCIMPLCIFLLLTVTKHKLTPTNVTLLTIASTLSSLIISSFCSYNYVNSYTAGSVVSIEMVQSIQIGGYTPTLNLSLDGLSIVMIMLISFIGLLVSIFYAWYFFHYVQHQKKYSLYTSYLHLLIFGMLWLVLTDGLLMLYLSWEVVTLSCFLLINFNIPRKKKDLNRYTSTSSFLINRMTNTLMAFGFIILFNDLQTDSILQINNTASAFYVLNQPNLILAGSLIAIGAIGLSAQFPLQSWLMKGDMLKNPSLIIVGSVVLTLGVYLMARLHVIFSLVPAVLSILAILAVLTIIMCTFAALLQTNVKLLIAFAGISQVSIMYLALSISAWQVAIFHLVSFVFFQVLLLISAECLVSLFNNQSDITKMGAIYHRIPLLFWSIIFGSCSLVALPFLTSSFYSLQSVLLHIQHHEYYALYYLSLFGIAMITMMVARMIWFIFFHIPQVKITINPIQGKIHQVVLIIFIILSTSAGMILNPQVNGILSDILPASEVTSILSKKEYLNTLKVSFIALLTIASGIFTIWLLYANQRGYYVHVLKNTTLGKMFYYSFHHAVGTGEIQQNIFMRISLSVDKWLVLTAKKQKKRSSKFTIFIVDGITFLNNCFLSMQSGSVRGYILAFVIALILLDISIVIL